MLVNIYAKNSGASAYDVIKEVPSTVNGYNIRKADEFIYSRPGYSYIGDSLDGNNISYMYSFSDISKSIISTSGCISIAEHSGYNNNVALYSGFLPDNNAAIGSSIVFYGDGKSINVYKSNDIISYSDTSMYEKSNFSYSAYSGSISNKTYHIGAVPFVGYSSTNGYEIIHTGIEEFKDIQIAGGVSLSAAVPSGSSGILWLCSDSRGSMPYIQGTTIQSSGNAVFNIESIDKNSMYEYDYNNSYVHISSLNGAMVCSHKDRTWAIADNKVYKSAKGKGRGLAVNSNYMQISSNKKIDKIFSCGDVLLASSSTNVSGEIWKISDNGFDYPTLLSNQQGILSDKILKINDKWYFVGSSGISYFDGKEIALIRQNTSWLNNKILEIISGSSNVCSMVMNDVYTNKSSFISTDGTKRITYTPDDGLTVIDSIDGTGYTIDANRDLISFEGHSIYNNTSQSSDDGSGIEMKYVMNNIYDFEANPSSNYKLLKISINIWSIDNPSASVSVAIKYRAWDSINSVLLPESNNTYNFSVLPYNGFITREYVLPEPSQIMLSNSLDLEVSIPSSYGKKVKSISLFFERIV